jgi:hypothetical protein
MIITDKIITTVNYLNIEYYKSIGYNDIKYNQKIEVNVLELALNSNLKISVKCDICGVEKNINYQKYNKNISKYDIYTCSNKCAHIKNKLTNKEKYNDENYVNIVKLKKTVKDKYDKITKEIENKGYIKCSKCSENKSLNNFVRNKNGRYKKVCKDCRTIQILNNRRNRDMSDYYKKDYKRNIHIYTWRNLLRNYLNRKSLRKLDTTFNMLKYSHIELKNHIESLFSENMNWSNYGNYWQIDHIVPVSIFKDDTPSYIVNALENLRPIEKEINNIKSNNISDDNYELVNKYKTYIKENYIK